MQKSPEELRTITEKQFWKTFQKCWEKCVDLQGEDLKEVKLNCKIYCVVCFKQKSRILFEHTSYVNRNHISWQPILNVYTLYKLNNIEP